MSEPEFDTVREFADWLKIGEAPIYRAIKKHEIRAVKVGGRIRIPRSERERLQRSAPGAANSIAHRLEEEAARCGITVSAMIGRMVDELREGRAPAESTAT
jgi:excisionase family DNA binding protein